MREVADVVTVVAIATTDTTAVWLVGVVGGWVERLVDASVQLQASSEDFDPFSLSFFRLPSLRIKVTVQNRRNGNRARRVRIIPLALIINQLSPSPTAKYNSAAFPLSNHPSALSPACLPSLSSPLFLSNPVLLLFFLPYPVPTAATTSAPPKKLIPISHSIFLGNQPPSLLFFFLPQVPIHPSKPPTTMSGLRRSSRQSTYVLPLYLPSPANPPFSRRPTSPPPSSNNKQLPSISSSLSAPSSARRSASTTRPQLPTHASNRLMDKWSGKLHKVKVQTLQLGGNEGGEETITIARLVFFVLFWSGGRGGEGREGRGERTGEE